MKEGGKAWILCISSYPCVPSLYNIKRTSRERIEDPDRSRKTETVCVYVQAVDEQNKNKLNDIAHKSVWKPHKDMTQKAARQ